MKINFNSNEKSSTNTINLLKPDNKNNLNSGNNQETILSYAFQEKNEIKNNILNHLSAKESDDKVTEENYKKKSQNSLSIYSYRKENTIYKENESMDSFLKFCSFVEDSTKPSAYFVYIEKSDSKDISSWVLYGSNLFDKGETENQVRRQLKSTEQKDLISGNKTIDSKKKYYKNLHKYSITFFYKETKNTLSNNIENNIEHSYLSNTLKHVEKREDLDSCGYKMKVFATLFNLAEIERLKREINIISNETFSPNLALISFKEKNYRKRKTDMDDNN